jgi:hypothetical protein
MTNDAKALQEPSMFLMQNVTDILLLILFKGFTVSTFSNLIMFSRLGSILQDLKLSQELKLKSSWAITCVSLRITDISGIISVPCYFRE